MSQLHEGKHLDASSARTNPVGHALGARLQDDVFVTSAGPDKKQGTQDDISVPKVRRIGDLS